MQHNNSLALKNSRRPTDAGQKNTLAIDLPGVRRPPAIANPRTRLAAGFSLIEILLSLGIFAIGMTAIVSLFPAAAIIQRETTQDVIAGMAAQSATSIINSQALTYDPPGTGRTDADLNAYHSATNSTNSQAFPFNVISTTLLNSRLPATDRSYPTGLVNGLDISDCDLHWVPFIQDIAGDAANPNWVVRLFILQADSRADYSGALPAGSIGINTTDPNTFPRVATVGISSLDSNSEGDLKVFNLSANIDLDPGDIVMDNNGNSHVVVNINEAGNELEVLSTISRVPNDPGKSGRLYYAPKMGGTSSPAKRVVTVQVNVVAP